MCSMCCCYVSTSVLLRIEDVKHEDNLVYEENMIQVLDNQVKQLKNKQIPLVKVFWRNHRVNKATWKVEQDMR